MLAAAWDLLAAHPAAALILALVTALGVTLARLRHSQASGDVARQAAEAADLRRRIGKLASEADRRKGEAAAAKGRADNAGADAEAAGREAAEAARKRQEIADRWKR